MRQFDVRAWLIWLFAAGLLSILTSNPFYLVLLLLLSRLVSFACAPAESRGWRLPLWRISALILFFSTLFNMLTAHFGQTIITALPANWPLIGGPITLEAAVFGFLNGLRLVTLLSFFLAFNTIVPVSQLARMAPRALHELGLVVIIAITYVPETIRQFHRIREAQAIRGHQLNGLRALRPILIPLLIAGLERALNLSEAMVSRGYGSTAHVATPPRARVLMLAALLLALGGALRLTWGGADGWALMAAAALVVAAAYANLSRLVAQTRYKPRRWTAADTLLAAGALLALWPLLTGGPSLAYSPYPAVLPPPFDLLVGVGLLGLAVPAALAVARPQPVEVTR